MGKKGPSHPKEITHSRYRSRISVFSRPPGLTFSRFPLSFLFIFFFCFNALHGYRENGYTFIPSGAQSTALGGNLTAGIPSLDGLYGNPALLLGYTNSIFSYEFDAEVRFKGIRTDYRLTFDSLPALGFLHKDYFGISFFSLLRGGVSQELGGAFNFSARKLGFTKAFALSPSFSLGFNVGPVIAFDRNGSTTAVSIFPSLQIGALWKPIPQLSLGAYVLSPNYFDYSGISGVNVQEWTPLYLGLGGNVEIARGFKLITELSYQGWDWISYTRNGVSETVSNGSGPFDLFQNFFFTLGAHYQSDGGSRARESFRAESSSVYNQLQDEIRILSSTPRMEALELDRKKLTEENRDLQKKIRDIRFKILGPEDEEKLAADQDRLARKETEYQFTTGLMARSKKPMSESERSDLRLKADKLESEIAELKTAIRERRENKIGPEEEKMIASYLLRQKEILRELDGLRSRQTRIKQEDEKDALAVESKLARGLVLSEEEEGIHQRRLRLAEKNEELQRIRARAAWVGFAPPRGEYYLSFSPEVIYKNDGSYLISGNLNAGFSFRPFNIDNLTFYLSFTDKSLFRLIGLFPDNDLVESVKISAELRL